MLVLLALGLARAEAPASRAEATYEVRVGDAVAGKRDVEWSWLPRGDRRVIGSHLRATALGKPLEVRCTTSLSPRGTTSTCAGAFGSDAWETNARRVPGGWEVRQTDHGGSITRAVTASASTLELQDAAIAAKLLAPGPMTLLVAETGEVLEGNVAPAQDVRLRVQGNDVAAQRYVIVAAQGRAVVDLDLEGALLGMALQTSLLSLSMTATAPPPARSWGAVEGIDLDESVRALP